MRNAKPLAPEVSGSKATPTVAGASATGPAGFAGGSTGPGPSVETGPVGADSLAATTSTGITPADGGYPGPNTTWNWFQSLRVVPIKRIGKLFFTTSAGNFVCSASTTSGGGSTRKDIIWTAGHCLHDGGNGSAGWHSNFLFCPAYNSGADSTIGCWGWVSASTTTAWFNSAAWSRDYGIIRSATNGTVLSGNVGSNVGTFGFAWNQARDKHWLDFGYPSGSPYTGAKLVVTAAEHRYDVTTDSFGPATNSIGSAQTPGFSGGPWILGFSGAGGYINSDNSFYKTSPTNEYGKEIQGPYFDTTSCNNWKSWTGWPGTC
jgi:hypothetical protein